MLSYTVIISNLRKVLPILIAVFSIGCEKSKEDRITKYLDVELRKRNLKIVENTPVKMWIAQIGDSREVFSPDLSNLYQIENEDSLRAKVKEKAEHIIDWFTMPKWDEAKQSVFPTIYSVSTISDSTLVCFPLSNDYEYSFTHINYRTHKFTPITKRELKTWNVPILDLANSAFNNLEKKINYNIYVDTLESRNVCRLEPNNQKYHSSLMFTDSFKKEAALTMDYPFYSVLQPWLYSTFLFAHKDLEFFKIYLKKTKNIEKLENTNPYKIKIIKYTESNIEIIDWNE